MLRQTKDKNSEYKELQKDLTPAEINDMNMQMFRVKSTIALVNSVVNAFTRHKDQIMSHNCDMTDLIGKSDALALCEALKDFDRTRGYRHPSVLKLELEGSNYIQSLMDMLWVGIHGHKTKRERDKEEESTVEPRNEYQSETPFGRYAYGRISENYRRIFEDKDNELPVLYKEAQLLSDAISGMTDSYLIRLHDELKSLYEYEYERSQKSLSPTAAR